MADGPVALAVRALRTVQYRADPALPSRLPLSCFPPLRVQPVTVSLTASSNLKPAALVAFPEADCLHLLRCSFAIKKAETMDSGTRLHTVALHMIAARLEGRIHNLHITIDINALLRVVTSFIIGYAACLGRGNTVVLNTYAGATSNNKLTLTCV